MLDFDMRYSPKYGLIQNWFMYQENTSSYYLILGTMVGRDESRERRAAGGGEKAKTTRNDGWEG
jgi:hypothetical protein